MRARTRVQTCFASDQQCQTAKRTRRRQIVFISLAISFFLERSEPELDQKAGGAERDRTDDLLLAKQALSQLSYGPTLEWIHVLKIRT